MSGFSPQMTSSVAPTYLAKYTLRSKVTFTQGEMSDFNRFCRSSFMATFWVLALCVVGLKPRPKFNAGAVVGAILYGAFNVVFLKQAFNLTSCRVGDGNQRAAKHFNLASCRNSSLKLLPVGIHASTSSRCETAFRSLVTPRRPSSHLSCKIYVAKQGYFCARWNKQF